MRGLYLARGDQFWQPKVVCEDQIWQLKVVRADHFWLFRVISMVFTHQDQRPSEGHKGNPSQFWVRPECTLKRECLSPSGARTWDF